MTTELSDSISAVVLVDYDNLRQNDRERTSSDAAQNLVDIRERIAHALIQLPIKIGEASLRIYGGWTDERGTLTLRGNWVLASIHLIRGLAVGIRFIPHLSISIAAKVLRLKGLYRVGRAVPEQKMVDTLIAVDGLYFCDTGSSIVIIATDDDDLVPALLAMSEKQKNRCCWLRTRPAGVAMNDGILKDQGVQVIQLRA